MVGGVESGVRIWKVDFEKSELDRDILVFKISWLLFFFYTCDYLKKKISFFIIFNIKKKVQLTYKDPWLGLEIHPNDMGIETTEESEAVTTLCELYNFTVKKKKKQKNKKKNSLIVVPQLNTGRLKICIKKLFWMSILRWVTQWRVKFFFSFYFMYTISAFLRINIPVRFHTFDVGRGIVT